MMSNSYADRVVYRRLVRVTDLVPFEVTVRETNLSVLAESDLHREVRDLVTTHRDRLERYLEGHPEFRESLQPVAAEATAPNIVESMARAGAAAGVGPMAAVAGAVCEAVADGLAGRTRELIIENGGDIYLSSGRERTVGIFPGEGNAGSMLALRIAAGTTPLGICTSSGRLGHSLSFGDAAAATVTAASCALADAAATAVGNRVRGSDGIREAIRAAQDIEGVLGVVVIRDGRLGAWGDVELVSPGGAAGGT